MLSPVPLLWTPGNRQDLDLPAGEASGFRGHYSLSPKRKLCRLWCLPGSESTWQAVRDEEKVRRGEQQRGRQKPQSVFFCQGDGRWTSDLQKTSRSSPPPQSAFSFQRLSKSWPQTRARLLEGVPRLHPRVALGSPGTHIHGAAAVAGHPSSGPRCPEMWSSKVLSVSTWCLPRGR